MQIHDLGGDAWTVRALSGPVPEQLRERLTTGVPATVPGVVHLDLLAAQLVPDPYDGENEAALQWIGLTDWEYSRTFEWAGTGEARTQLAADGLDTVATVTLNGVEVGRTANQHRSYRFDVASALREGQNELRATFRSPVEYAREQELVLGERPHVNHHPYNAIRKTAANFGWDWGPDVATSGIWKALRIESWSGARIASVRPLVTLDGSTGRLTAHVALDWAGSDPAGSDPVDVSLDLEGNALSAQARPGAAEVVLELEVPDVEPWWPRGYGKQRLYPLTVTVPGQQWESRVGFRDVALDTTPDADGTPFTIVVNGQPVYAKGVNWIPDDTFFPRITRASLGRSLTDAVEANVNLVRVWGGGIYESEEFYDLCDELGLLVWQDFLLACAAYSEDEPLWSEFEAEAREAVTRLTAHPSLALWNGSNENIVGWVDWGWRPRLAGATWGDGYYTELFPQIVAELAPGTPYSAGSPFGFSKYVHPNDPAHGTVHIWDIWNQVDYTHYRGYRPRFVSEFGFQGPPAWSTLTAVVHDEPLDPFGPQMLVHQKANDGNGKLERGLGTHLPRPGDIDTWHATTQLNQARAVAYGIEWFRSLFPLNTGAIVWQLNDCWPVVSWAAVDGLGRRKPLWYALRKAFADRLATIQPAGEGATLALHNDTTEPWSAHVVLCRITLDGTELARHETEVLVEPRTLERLELGADLLAPSDPGGELVVAELSTGERALHYFVEDTELALRDDALTVETARDGDEVVLRLSATSVVKDVVVHADRVDPEATADESLVTVLPGETREVRIRTSAEPEALTSAPVLRSVNDLV
ncbi:glycoside hydrolase family 2 protein [Promicromonospora sp. NPDC050262]|uniref:glycoside hydrolase family 2 protein n=1 Tax=Promicromonospora sp. NPDC050262 TaxID=3155036 RepID=UPI0033E89D7E